MLGAESHPFLHFSVQTPSNPRGRSPSNQGRGSRELNDHENDLGGLFGPQEWRGNDSRELEIRETGCQCLGLKASTFGKRNIETLALITTLGVPFRLAVTC